ncbi:F0F1 ATP synthase subunit B [Williamsia serinedens]|uniref:ATP synthase subunit b n=1 Tax=Williamsia serinedens TaxID=391736 RepID=A0ABT1H6Y2_9NOCA|nr:F0F1 ATP synthase subunit B [Williamsia serinedens]MCP2162886.1 F-type H+-transporting ATPase subunit b [Williamsia serinedens]
MALAAGNFLIPNGTFFVVLVIFGIVLLVIGKFVVPPIKKVLDERDEQVARTGHDNRTATEEFEAAEREYREAMKSARGEATGIRDEARAKGRETLDQMRQRATAEADGAVAEATDKLRGDGEKAAAAAREDVGRLSADLASRVLGFDVTSDSRLADKFTSASTSASSETRQPSGTGS